MNAAKVNPESAPAEVATPGTLEMFMAQAVTMEIEAAQRYEELADAMETHNNVEVAKLFRTMAGVEGKHAQQLMAQMRWTTVPPAPPLIWDATGSEGPETAASDEVHYLMQPWHALQIALHNEERAERFFARIATIAQVEPVRKAARELQEEEREHVELVKAWLAKVPQPDENWAVDPDPPRYTD